MFLEVDQLTNFSYLKEKSSLLIDFKNNNLILFSIGFILFSIIWVFLLGFASPLAVISGFLFGPILGTLLCVIGFSVGCTILYTLANFYFKELVNKINEINLDFYDFNEAHDKIINLIQSGIDEGATLAAGGPELPGGLNKGYFIKPTIFTDVTNDMRIAKEEIFGPVLSIIPFETEDEAVNIVNETEYGLGNYLQTEDKEKAKRVARRLNAGTIYINGNGADSGTPFGGFKQSGNGREGGVWGLEEYLEVKTVTGWPS